MATNKPQADEGLDSLLGELDSMAAATEPEADDLGSLLDDLGVANTAATQTVPTDDFDRLLDAPPAAEAQVTAAAEPEPARVAKRKLRLPGRIALITAAALLLSHAALFGLGYWLGGKSAPAGEAAGHAEGPAPLEGVLRHVGHPADLRVDGHLIFTTPEVRNAVLELNGGQALADALEKFARRVRSLGPVTRTGDVLEARACNPDRCGAEAFSLRYNAHTHAVWVCQTVPYEGGASLSYLYGEEGMEEVARCTDQTPLPQPSTEPADADPPNPSEPPSEAAKAPAKAERQFAHPGRAPANAEHSAVD